MYTHTHAHTCSDCCTSLRWERWWWRARRGNRQRVRVSFLSSCPQSAHNRVAYQPIWTYEALYYWIKIISPPRAHRAHSELLLLLRFFLYSTIRSTALCRKCKQRDVAAALTCLPRLWTFTFSFPGEISKMVMLVVEHGIFGSLQHSDPAFCRVRPSVPLGYCCRLRLAAAVQSLIRLRSFTSPSCKEPLTGDAQDRTWNLLLQCEPAFCRVGPFVHLHWYCPQDLIKLTLFHISYLLKIFSWRCQESNPSMIMIAFCYTSFPPFPILKVPRLFQSDWVDSLWHELVFRAWLFQRASKNLQHVEATIPLLSCNGSGHHKKCQSMVVCSFPVVKCLCH